MARAIRPSRWAMNRSVLRRIWLKLESQELVRSTGQRSPRVLAFPHRCGHREETARVRPSSSLESTYQRARLADRRERRGRRERAADQTSTALSHLPDLLAVIVQGNAAISPGKEGGPA